MAWTIEAGQWPNGRRYWTIEDRKAGRICKGPKGGVSRFHDFDEAVRECNALNRDTDTEPDTDACILIDPDDPLLDPAFDPWPPP